MSEFPAPDVAMTHLLVVSDVERAKEFYRDVLGATVYREYGGTSCVLQFQGTWLLLVTGGEPTEDKPDVVFAPPSTAADASRATTSEATSSQAITSHSMTMRVEDCRAAYEILRARGAVFLTPLHDWGPEIRCFFRDPDGHLLEISEAVAT